MRRSPRPRLPFVSGKGEVHLFLLTFVMLVRASLLTPLGLA